MTILGIETSGPTASVALLRDGAVVGERSFAAHMILNQRLAVEVRELTGSPAAEAGLDAIAVGIGPGSFTGVRMGVALAKALAHALELPLVGVSAPEAIAAGLGAATGASVCVLQRARADEVYATALEVGEDGLPVERAETVVLCLPTALRAAAEALGRAPDVVCGDAAAHFADDIAGAFPDAALAGDEHALARASLAARVAEGRIAAADPDAAFALSPRYVRLSQAEREFGVDLGLRGSGHA